VFSPLLEAIDGASLFADGVPQRILEAVLYTCNHRLMSFASSH